MLFYLVIAFQAFCIYHLLKNRHENYWILLIIFLPIIGCIIYLFARVYNKNNVEKINVDVSARINPTKRVQELEKRLEFVETYQNRVDLADAYLDAKDYEKSIHNYKIALKDELQNNNFVLKNLVKALYHSSQYEEVLFFIEKLKKLENFEGSESQFLYGLTLEKLDRLVEAEQNLRPIDQRYSHYDQRLVLAKFLMRNGKAEDAKEVIDEIFLESRNMNKSNSRKYRATINEVEELRSKA